MTKKWKRIYIDIRLKQIFQTIDSLSFILASDSDEAVEIIRNNALRGMAVTGDAIFKVAKKLVLQKQNKKNISSSTESQKEINELRNKIKQQDEERFEFLKENKALQRQYDNLAEKITMLQKKFVIQIEQTNEICRQNVFLREEIKDHNVVPYEIPVDLEEEIEALKQNEHKILRAKKEVERQLDEALNDLDYVKQSMETIREMVLPGKPNASTDDTEEEIEKLLKTAKDIVQVEMLQNNIRHQQREERRLKNLVADKRRELQSTEFQLRNAQLLQRRNEVSRSLNQSNSRPSPKHPMNSRESRPPTGRRSASARSMVPTTPLPAITVSPVDGSKTQT